MSDSKRDPKDMTNKERAAHGHLGQEQEPVQAEPTKGRSIFDTDQHSDAPGPTGTGGPAPKVDEES